MDDRDVPAADQMAQGFRSQCDTDADSDCTSGLGRTGATGNEWHGPDVCASFEAGQFPCLFGLLNPAHGGRGGCM